MGTGNPGPVAINQCLELSNFICSSEFCEVGDDVQSNQVRECLRHAEDCAQQAASQTNPKLRRDYLIIGAYWLKLSQELSERPLPLRHYEARLILD